MGMDLYKDPQEAAEHIMREGSKCINQSELTSWMGCALLVIAAVTVHVPTGLTNICFGKVISKGLGGTSVHLRSKYLHTSLHQEPSSPRRSTSAAQKASQRAPGLLLLGILGEIMVRHELVALEPYLTAHHKVRDGC